MTPLYVSKHGHDNVKLLVLPPDLIHFLLITSEVILREA